MVLARMRTIRQAAKAIQAADPGNACGEWFIRRAIKDGHLPYVNSGNRQLINLDTLERFLSEEHPIEMNEPEIQPGKIRRINAR